METAELRESAQRNAERHNYGTADVLNRAADEIERQQREIAKLQAKVKRYGEALEQYANKSNWSRVEDSFWGSFEDDPAVQWQQSGDGWELAEKALSPDEPLEK